MKYLLLVLFSFSLNTAFAKNHHGNSCPHSKSALHSRTNPESNSDQARGSSQVVNRNGSIDPSQTQ